MNRDELYLYKVSAEGSDRKAASVVILPARSEEEAFRAAEKELERHFLSLPENMSLVIEEKRRVRAGNGYVIEPFGPATE